MPLDNRIDFTEEPRKDGTRIVARLVCDYCGGAFTRESFVASNAEKGTAWKIKEGISDELRQHKH